MEEVMKFSWYCVTAPRMSEGLLMTQMSRKQPWSPAEDNGLECDEHK